MALREATSRRVRSFKSPATSSNLRLIASSSFMPHSLPHLILRPLFYDDSLVVMEKRAQKHLYRLNPQTLSQFETWVQQTRQRWEERFEALDRVLEDEKQKLAQREQERK